MTAVLLSDDRPSRLRRYGDYNKSPTHNSPIRGTFTLDKFVDLEQVYLIIIGPCGAHSSDPCFVQNFQDSVYYILAFHGIYGIIVVE